MTIRRLLTSLAAHQPTPSHSASRLIPPYSHVYSATTPSTLRPPYSYSASPAQGLPLGAHEVRGRSLKAKVKYEIYHREGKIDGWSAWVENVLGSEEQRREVEAAWVETLAGLESIKSSGQNQIPQIAFHSLAGHLASESTVDAIRNAGAVIIRDVVPDAEAIEWAREILQAINDAGERGIYWNPALIAARANTSVLSANAQLAHSLLGQEVYIQADTVREGIAPFRTTPSPYSPWSSPRALLAHLALTPIMPSPTGAAPQPTCLPPSVHAATYTLLRPLFRPLKSKIAFYDSSSYLNPANWVLDPTISHRPSPAPDFPHLAGTEVVLPELLPGDVLFHHTALPLSTQPVGQIFLPIHPVEKEGNETWIVKQREAFEKGVPPPGVSEVADDLCVVEPKGKRSDIGSRAGREAMGYEY
ncbi:hypothetical protein C356_05138 [Cryptococcus neoformans c45]|nr:hypothetical protein C356_05138 [Cryptococcus neoformans var. grubii c45]